MFDLVIREATVYDGTGNPGQRGDVAVAGDRIAAFAPSLEGRGRREIPASGLALCPGFIDMHSHSDLMVLVEPLAEIKIRQGVTTEVIGQDGIGPAPVDDERVTEWRRFLAGLAGNPFLHWDWRSLAGYLDRLEAACPAVNVATYLPQGNVRLLVMGIRQAWAGEQDFHNMERLIDDGMKAGAFGMSTGLIYPPCLFSDEAELIRLYRRVADWGGIMVVHMRNEGNFLLESLEEAIRIAGKAGLPLHISHFKAGGRSNWDKFAAALARIDREVDGGMDVTYDQYPYTAASTLLMALLPPWALEGGVDATMGRLADRETRRRIARDINGDGPGCGESGSSDGTQPAWDNYVQLAGWEGIMITAVKTPANRQFEGAIVTDAAAQVGKTPAEFVFDLLLEEECAVSMAAMLGSEENVRLGLQHRLGMVGTDGLLGGKPHPRVGGSYPRILGRYVREEGVISLPQAIRKMTGFPATRLGLDDRGLIKPGYAADLVLFDPSSVMDRNTFTEPRLPPLGIRYVLVNGVPVLADGELTGQRAGRVLRKC
ncbi:MAG: D-aminoacylase [Firmicutes bacterium]|nr:D-aminoacylase [Bacillota bacterium]